MQILFEQHKLFFQILYFILSSNQFYILIYNVSAWLFNVKTLGNFKLGKNDSRNVIDSVALGSSCLSPFASTPPLFESVAVGEPYSHSVMVRLILWEDDCTMEGGLEVGKTRDNGVVVWLRNNESLNFKHWGYWDLGNRFGMTADFTRCKKGWKWRRQEYLRMNPWYLSWALRLGAQREEWVWWGRYLWIEGLAL